jgi:DNA-binding NarL/FixJ family response regulator
MQTAITRTSGPGRVLLVDDHPAVRRVLRSLLEEVGGWQVVGEADSGEAAIPLVEQLAPDVVLMDCRMPGQGGVATTREIVQRWPDVAVVAHTAYADETYVREMVAAGARGYVLKGDVPAAVLEALSAARQGQARGEGVAEIDRERIFSPFTQLDASTTRKVGGVGLGLFLVDRLVRGMGGRVWVEDNEGGGARFVVELPDQAPV